MHMRMHAWCNLCIIVCITKDVSGWGKIGHFVSSKIALSLLSDEGRQFLTDIYKIRGNQLEQVVMHSSLWPDSVSYTPAYDWSRDMHFGTTPDDVCDGFELNRDCRKADGSGVCTVLAIGNYTERAIDPVLSSTQRQEAMNFVLHFVADIHQPLHVGFTGDRGGNMIYVFPPWDMARDQLGRVIHTPRQLNLHYLWDTHILSYMLKKLGTSWVELTTRTISALKGSTNELPFLAGTSMIDHFSAVASDSSNWACGVAYSYMGKRVSSGSHLPMQYYDTAGKVIWNQLTKSGIEIARVINTLAISSPY